MASGLVSALKAAVPAPLKRAIKSALGAGTDYSAAAKELTIHEDETGLRYDPLESVSTPLIPLSEKLYAHAFEAAKKSTPASELDAEIQARFQQDPLLTLKLPESARESIHSTLVFDQDFSNRHARTDWRGNTVASMTDKMKISLPKEGTLKRVYDAIYAADTAKFIASCVGARFTVLNVRFIQSLPHEAKGAGPQSYHVDGCPPGMLRGLIYLTDVDEISGPFEYLDEAGAPQKACAPKGTLLVFDANRMRHRGSPPTGKKREVVDLVIAPLPAQRKAGVIWCGQNNWPYDPYHFSLQDALVYP
jgi:hypothetical protein